MTTYAIGGVFPGAVPGSAMAGSTMPGGAMPGGPMSGGSMLGGGMPGAMPRLPQGGLAAERPVTARQPISEEALRQQAAALLQHVYRWLEASASVAPQVLGVVPMLVIAVQLYEAQQYPACLDQVQSAIGVLQQARWAFPALPPL